MENIRISLEIGSKGSFSKKKKKNPLKKARMI